MLSPNSVFRLICNAIQPILDMHGFVKTEDENHPEIFGSQYATFVDAREKIRILWDGKEKWFVLETIPLNSPTYSEGGSDILLQFFKPEQATEETAYEIIAEMSASLSAYLNTVDK